MNPESAIPVHAESQGRKKLNLNLSLSFGSYFPNSNWTRPLLTVSLICGLCTGGGFIHSDEIIFPEFRHPYEPFFILIRQCVIAIDFDNALELGMYPSALL